MTLRKNLWQDVNLPRNTLKFEKIKFSTKVRKIQKTLRKTFRFAFRLSNYKRNDEDFAMRSLVNSKEDSSVNGKVSSGRNGVV